MNAEEKLKLFSQQVAKLKPRAIILFGSYARGDFTEESDIDVCLVAEELPKDPLKRRSLSGLYRVRGVRAIGYYPEEFLSELEKPNTFIHEILAEGKVLYDNNFINEASKLQRSIAERLGVVRRGRAWRIKAPAGED